MDRILRSKISQLGGLALAASQDPRQYTAPARAKFLERFEDEVDPNRQLSEAERRRRAEAARRLYFRRLALKSAQARAERGAR